MVCIRKKELLKVAKEKTIYANSIIENSVFNKITTAALLENDKVILNVVGS